MTFFDTKYKFSQHSFRDFLDLICIVLIHTKKFGRSKPFSLHTTVERGFLDTVLRINGRLIVQERFYSRVILSPCFRKAMALSEDGNARILAALFTWGAILKGMMILFVKTTQLSLSR